MITEFIRLQLGGEARFLALLGTSFPPGMPAARLDGYRVHEGREREAALAVSALTEATRAIFGGDRGLWSGGDGVGVAVAVVVAVVALAGGVVVAAGAVQPGSCTVSQNGWRRLRGRDMAHRNGWDMATRRWGWHATGVERVEAKPSPAARAPGGARSEASPCEQVL